MNFKTIQIGITKNEESNITYQGSIHLKDSPEHLTIGGELDK